jgi:hypothetical protein
MDCGALAYGYLERGGGEAAAPPPFPMAILANRSTSCGDPSLQEGYWRPAVGEVSVLCS